MKDTNMTFEEIIFHTDYLIIEELLYLSVQDEYYDALKDSQINNYSAPDMPEIMIEREAETNDKSSSEQLKLIRSKEAMNRAKAKLKAMNK